MAFGGTPVVRYTCGNAGGADANHLHVDKTSPGAFPIMLGNDTVNVSGVIDCYIQYHSTIHR